MSAAQVVFIHGLFGENIRAPKNCRVESPYFLKSLSDLKLSSETTIIAYSFGGRKLLSLIDSEGLPDVNHIHIVSTHLGCDNKAKRIKLEDSILEQMKKDTFSTFWNQLPLFKNDEKIDINLKKMPLYRELFDNNRLSNSPDYNNLVSTFQHKITLHCGELDHKILEQYIKFENTVIHAKCGHRAPIYMIMDSIERGMK